MDVFGFQQSKRAVDEARKVRTAPISTYIVVEPPHRKCSKRERKYSEVNAVL